MAYQTHSSATETADKTVKHSFYLYLQQILTSPVAS